MLQTLLQQVIEFEFARHVGRPETPQQMMLVRVKVPVPGGFEGYAQKTLVIYAPSNYVQVWSRQEWDMVPSEGLLDNEEEGLKEGYVKGSTPWTKLAHHDSCWREGVREFTQSLENALSFHESFWSKSWYVMVSVPEEARMDLKGFLDTLEPMARDY